MHVFQYQESQFSRDIKVVNSHPTKRIRSDQFSDCSAETQCGCGSADSSVIGSNVNMNPATTGQSTCCQGRAMRIPSSLQHTVPSVVVLLVTCALALMTSTGLALTTHRPLNEYVSHYEPINYDLDRVENSFAMWKSEANDVNRPLFSLDLFAFGRVFRLVLSEDQEILPASVTHQAGDGQPFEFDSSHQLAGSIHGDAESHVHGFISAGRFRGVIRASQETYHVEPSAAYFPTLQPFHSIMYRESDVDHEKLLQGRPIDAQTIAEEHFRRAWSKTGGGRSRRADSPDLLLKVQCRIAVAGDHFFAKLVAKEEAIGSTDTSGLRSAMTRVMALYIREANKILQTTTFLDTSGSKPEGVRLAIGTVVTFVTAVEMKAFFGGKTKLGEDFLGSGSVLEEWSKENWGSFCLSHLFTNRQFSGGILGLAYVGGVCTKFSTTRKQSTNTGLVTLTNEGNRLPSSMSWLVYLHEVGHNLGAKHDKAAECLPTDSKGGKYIMFENANDGSLANNRMFSSCSKTSIAGQLRSKGFVEDGCFEFASNGSICGNNVRENEEQCDCGLASQCLKEHFCCTNKCLLRPGVACSPQQGPCCSSSTCSFVLSSSNVTCSEPHECRIGLSVCNGTTSTCPVTPPKSDGTVCNKGRASCKDGECTDSLCAHFGTKRCFCGQPSQCHVCCMHEGKCRTLDSLSAATPQRFNVTGLELFLPPGAPCNDFAGSCNFLHVCRQLSDSSALLDVHNFLFSASTYEAAYLWIKANWWIVILSGFGLVVLFSIVIYQCSYKTPQKILRVRNSHRMPQSGPSNAPRRTSSSDPPGKQSATSSRHGTSKQPHNSSSATSQNATSVSRQQSTATHLSNTTRSGVFSASRQRSTTTPDLYEASRQGTFDEAQQSSKNSSQRHSTFGSSPRPPPASSNRCPTPLKKQVTVMSDLL
ncbi:disintegrin and metalloproteinase domain-containing protein 10-like isoform X1 [Sycon ciliatum]|uniref:disintegrin and metalloproteinase domain-containing protein 10-like isoform X1 n=2 Tax=Sycon ciliatum TaxID=27933 RepID=UPI0031F70EBB